MTVETKIPKAVALALSATQAGLSSGRLAVELASAASTTANLTAACRGILDTTVALSSSHWYPALYADLQELREVAARWQQQHARGLRSHVVLSVAEAAGSFRDSREQLDRIFAGAGNGLGDAKASLHAWLTRLQGEVQVVIRAAVTYEVELRKWGRSLEQAHEKLAATIREIQHEAAGIQGEIVGLNATMSAMQAEIIRDRREIAMARSARDQAIVQTIFGVLFAPTPGALSLVLAGIGVASIAEAEGKVKALEQLIAEYRGRITAAQASMSQEQAQVASLQALTLSAGIARSDSASAQQLLDGVRTGWEAFGQELAGVIRKIGRADSASEIAVERAWWSATVREWELIARRVAPLLGTRGETVLIDRTLV